MKYPKIQTVYKRVLEPGPDKGKLIEGAWTFPEFEALQDMEWEATEKIDGTNIRISWDAKAQQVGFKGHRENPIDYASLVTYLASTFTPSLFNDAELTSMTLYGEGYGKGIQKPGKLYNPNGVSFILFDILVVSEEGPLWLSSSNIDNIAKTLKIDVVPYWGTMTLYAAVQYVKGGFKSAVPVKGHEALAALPQAEGLVLRAPCGMRNRRGGRIITKIKTKDFIRGYANV